MIVPVAEAARSQVFQQHTREAGVRSYFFLIQFESSARVQGPSSRPEFEARLRCTPDRERRSALGIEQLIAKLHDGQVRVPATTDTKRKQRRLVLT